jgi:hypothetical protein
MKATGTDDEPEYAGRAKCRIARVRNFETIQQIMVEEAEDQIAQAEHIELSDQTDKIHEGLMTRARLSVKNAEAKRKLMETENKLERDV